MIESIKYFKDLLKKGMCFEDGYWYFDKMRGIPSISTDGIPEYPGAEYDLRPHQGFVDIYFSDGSKWIIGYDDIDLYYRTISVYDTNDELIINIDHNNELWIRPWEWTHRVCMVTKFNMGDCF